MSRDYIGYSLFNYSFKLVFDCGVVLHLKLGNPQGTDPVSHREGVCRLHWILIPGPFNTGLYKSYTMLMDLGSVSTGYSDRPVARAIKIKHAGLNLTGRTLE